MKCCKCEKSMEYLHTRADEKEENIVRAWQCSTCQIIGASYHKVTVSKSERVVWHTDKGEKL